MGIGSTVASVFGAKKSSDAQADAANKSAEMQQETANKSLALQKEMYNTSREDLSSWRNDGESALKTLQQGIKDGSFNVGSVDVTQDPSYQFRMNEGIDALDKSAASRGRLLSGAQQQAVTDYAQNLASTEYSNAYARQSAEKTNQYNMLANLSNTGQNAAAMQASSNSNLASTAANTYSNLSSGLANSYYNYGQAKANGYTNMTTALNTGIQNMMTSAMSAYGG